MKYFDEDVDKSSKCISPEKVRDLFDVNKRMIDYSAGIVQYDLPFFDKHCLRDVSGFGTGKDEVCHSVGDLLNRVERSWKQRPEDMRFEFNTLRATLFDNIAIIEGLTNCCIQGCCERFATPRSVESSSSAIVTSITAPAGNLSKTSAAGIANHKQRTRLRVFCSICIANGFA